MPVYNNWLTLSIFASFFFIGSELLYKFTDCSNIQPELYVSVMWMVGGLLGLIYYLYNNFYQTKMSSSMFRKISLISLLVFLGNIVYWKSAHRGTNPGLTRGVFSSSLVILLTIASALILKRTLVIQQTIGIFLLMLGTILIAFYSET